MSSRSLPITSCWSMTAPRRSSLPEVPLLAVLPGTGGLTRVTDKRKVRRDHADVFCTTEEGVKGKRAVEWRLVDEVVPRRNWKRRVKARADELPRNRIARPGAKGIALTPLEAQHRERRCTNIRPCRAQIDREPALRPSPCAAPTLPPPANAAEHRRRAPISGRCALARELDDAILDIAQQRARHRRHRVQVAKAIRRRCWPMTRFLDANQVELAGARNPASTGSAC